MGLQGEAERLPDINTAALARCDGQLQALSRFNGFLRRRANCCNSSLSRCVLGHRAKATVLLRSPQHTLRPKRRRLLSRPFRRGEGLLGVVYPTVLAVTSFGPPAGLLQGYIATQERSLSSLAVVTNRHHAAIKLDHRIAPRQVATGSFAFGMLDSPSDDLPSIPRLHNLPFGPIRPILLLLQQSLCHLDLVAIAALRILGVIHATVIPAASGEQRETKHDKPASGHPLMSAGRRPTLAQKRGKWRWRANC